MTTDHGLVIGKFYPPHAGHMMLIRAAAAASRRVTVLVLVSSGESIGLRDREAWVRETHRRDTNVTVLGVPDDLPVDLDDPVVWARHISLYREAVATLTDEPVTAVFTSEDYGAELARRLDATNVVVDLQRELTPVSATMLRADPIANWERLVIPARQWFARRVVVIGAESTGKTTLSIALTDALRARGGAHGLTRWVPEFGREFTVDKLAAARALATVDGQPQPVADALEWHTDEFVEIARVQNEMEDEAARIGGPVLICDTDAFATGVWHTRYQGSGSPAVDAIARKHPLYLLTHHDDVPFAADGIRDGEAIRAWMTEEFLGLLAASGRRTVVLRGTHDERVEHGLAAIDELIVEGWHLAEPRSL